MSDPTLPRTLPQLLDWIEHYADTIYVREKIDARCGAAALSSLPAKRALFHAFRWVREGVIPVRVRAGEDEDAAD